MFKLANQPIKWQHVGLQAWWRRPAAVQSELQKRGRKGIEGTLKVAKMVFGPSVSPLIFWDFHIIATVRRVYEE